MATLYVKEGETAWFPNLRLDDLPDNLPAGVQILSKRGYVGLRVDGLVGAIPIGESGTLRITPKIGNANFFAMFFRAEGSLSEVENEFHKLVDYSFEAERSLEKVVARSLIYSASEIMRRSPLIKRIEKFEASSAATGAIDAVSTVKRLKTGSDQPVVSKRKIRSTNIPENRLISVALQRALPLLNELEKATLSPIVSNWIKKFPTSTEVLRDLEEVERGLAKNRYGGPRGYYQTALVSALIILGTSGLSLSGSESARGDAVLLNTADVFEKYLRNTLSSHYSKRGLLVTKAGLERASLYTNGSFSLEPDIVIYKDERLVLLCDAKYKIPTAADHYQMHTYLRSFKVKSGLLLCPNFESNHVEEKVFQSPDGSSVREIYLPMGDMEMAEDCLVNLVDKYSL